MSCSMYRAFDADDKLLYVGISTNALKRAGQHERDKKWWTRVARIDVQHFENRGLALAAEVEAISSEKPQYNIRKPRGSTSPDELERRRQERAERDAAREAELAEQERTMYRVARVVCGNCGDKPFLLPKGVLIVEVDCPTCGCKTLARNEEQAA